MTAEEHNKYLGMAHLVYAGLHSVMGVFFGAMMIVMFSTMPSSTRAAPPPPPAFYFVMAAFALVFTIGWVIPSMIAGYALLKRKKWAKTASIVAAVFAAAQLPVGTAVAVYTFWFVFGDVGRSLYDWPATSSLPGANADSTATQLGQKEQEIRVPPDWR